MKLVSFDISKLNLRLILSLNIIALLLLIQNTYCYSNELSKGSGSSTKSGSDLNSNTQSSDLQCPETLVKWAEDDNKGVVFDSAQTICKEAVASSKSFNDSNSIAEPISTPQNYSKYLSNKYESQIHPNVRIQLQGCLTLPADKTKALQTRFYSAASRIEAVQNANLGEIAFIDSILPPAKPALSDIQCDNSFLTEAQKKCKSLNGLVCRTSAEDRFKNQVAKTERVLKAKIMLMKVLQNCNNEIKADIQKSGKTNKLAYKTKCGPIEAAMEVLTNQTPWVNGEEFKKIADVKKPSVFSKNQEIDFPPTEKIEQAIKKQLAVNRKAKVEEYEQNQKDFSCLSGIRLNNQTSECDFKKIRSRVSEMPDLSLVKIDPDNKNDQAFEKNLTAESCLLKAGQKQQEKVDTAIDVGTEAALLSTGFITGGVGFAVGAAGRTLSTVSRASKLRRGSLIAFTGASTLGFAGQGLNQAYESCSKESDALIKSLGKSEITKKNICADPQSEIEQAKEEETSCLVDALLSSADIIPLLGPAIGLLKFLKPLSEVEKLEILKSLKDPKQRELVEKLLNKNGNLSEPERLKAAEYLLGRKLKPGEGPCIMAAHNVGQGRNLIMPGTLPGQGNNYTQADIDQKKDIQKKCGIVGAELGLLMRAGITGSSPQKLADIVEARLKKLRGDNPSTIETEKERVLAAISRYLQEAQKNPDANARTFLEIKLAKDLEKYDQQSAKEVYDKLGDSLSGSTNYRTLITDGKPGTLSHKKAADVFAASDNQVELQWNLRQMVKDGDYKKFFDDLDIEAQKIIASGGSAKGNVRLYIIRNQQRGLLEIDKGLELSIDEKKVDLIFDFVNTFKPQ